MPEVPARGLRHGCLGAALILFVFVALVIGGGAWWLSHNVERDPEKVAAAAHELLDFEFPPETPPRMMLQYSGYTMIWGGATEQGEDGPMIVLAGSKDKEKLDRETLLAGPEDQAKNGVIESGSAVFRLRGKEETALVLRYRSGEVEYTLSFDGKEAGVMLVFRGPPEQVTQEWVQGVLDGIP